jgi:O-methyltransferase domain
MLLQKSEELDATAKADTVPPHAAIVQLLFGKHIGYSVSAMARLGVADHMGDDPANVETLARKVGAQADALYRVMRVLAGAGVVEETSDRSFRLTPVGETLRTDAPVCMRYTAMQMGDPWSTRPWEHFADTIRTGIDGVTQAFGKNAFELLAEEPEQAENFNRSMSGYSAAMMDAILAGYDFSSIRRLADVGGGHGKLLSALLSRYPEMTGVVYDLPEVVAGALGQEHLAHGGHRMSFEAGSFFERVPSGCDAYMMKFIMHDWSDEHCKTILRRIREQLPANGRVLVIEQIVTSSPDLSFAKLLDLEMLALTLGGRERTAAEFAELFASVGLMLTRVVSTQSPVSILEARAATSRATE